MTIAPQPFTDADDLPQPREPVAHVRLKFSGDATGDDHPIHDLSACARVENTLFVAGDEASGIERLHLRDDGTLAHHARFPLRDFVKLRDPEAEMDIEGLSYADGWLWVTGSHSRTRPDPRRDGAVPDRIDVKAFADLKDTRPRCVLARIPVKLDSDGLPRPVKKDGDRRAGLVKQKKKHGSKLARYLAKNPLLAPSTAMAAKEGGLDVEGIAVSGDRVVLGLRGPVLQTFAVLVEPAIRPKRKGKLHLPGKPLLRLVDLNGLGVRDLLVKGDDLWILAGPTGDRSFSAGLFDDAAQHGIEKVIFTDEAVRWTRLAGDHPRQTGAEVIAEAEASGLTFD